MPHQTKAPTARRAYKTQIKAARRANKVARVVSAPARRERRRAAANRFIGGVGKMLAPMAHAGIGALTKRAMSVISGQGDYDISGITQNSLIGKMSPVVPQFSSNLNGSIRVVHREYIKDILSSTDFNLSEFPINPALPVTFPWLSRIAQQFEQYRFHGLIFEFKSGSSDALNSTNTALGYVISSTEFNSLAPGYSNKLEMENALFCCSTKPSLSMIHAVECMPNQSPLSVLYTRTGFESIGLSDIRMYDLGRFCIATVGMQQAAVNVGELWCSYDVELYKTRFLPPGITIPTWSVQFQNTSEARLIFGEITNEKTNTLGLVLTEVFDIPTSTAIATFTLPPGSGGTYLFNYEIMGHHKNVGFTKPIQEDPYGNFQNIVPVQTYTNYDEKKGILRQELSAYNDRNTDDANQDVNSFSDFMSFTFSVPNNNLSASFTISLPQNILDSMVRPEDNDPRQIGVSYITQVNPEL